MTAKLQIGQVIRVRTKRGPALAIVKAPLEGQTIRCHDQDGRAITDLLCWAYIPGHSPALKDIGVRQKHMIDQAARCPECQGDRWYWIGGDPLFPDEIVCASCRPPEIRDDEKRAAVIEVLDAHIQKESYGGELDFLKEPFSEKDWPELQKLLFMLWLGLMVPMPSELPPMPDQEP